MLSRRSTVRRMVVIVAAGAAAAAIAAVVTFGARYFHPPITTSREVTQTYVATALHGGLGIAPIDGPLGSYFKSVRVEYSDRVLTGEIDAPGTCRFALVCTDGRVVLRGRCGVWTPGNIPIPDVASIRECVSFDRNGNAVGTIRNGTGTIRVWSCNGLVQDCTFTDSKCILCTTVEPHPVEG